MAAVIHYIIGDATNPKPPGNKIIVHICNDIGAWGKGFVLALSKRWSEPEKQYRAWFTSKENFSLGECQFIKVEKDVWVANIIGQHKIYNDEKGNAPIRYLAVENGLSLVAQFAKVHKASVHMPRIGCGLAGGTWDKIEPLIHKSLLQNDIETYVYDLVFNA